MKAPKSYKTPFIGAGGGIWRSEGDARCGGRKIEYLSKSLANKRNLSLSEGIVELKNLNFFSKRTPKILFLSP